MFYQLYLLYLVGLEPATEKSFLEVQKPMQVFLVLS